MLGPMVGEDRGADDNSASGHSPPGPVPPGRGGSRCEPHAVIGPSPDLNPPGTRRRWWPRPPREGTGWPLLHLSLGADPDDRGYRVYRAGSHRIVVEPSHLTVTAGGVALVDRTLHSSAFSAGATLGTL